MTHKKLLAALALALLVLRPHTARADDAANAAREHFRKGAVHAQAGEVEAAAREFEEAYRLRPHYSVLYNLGQAYLVMGRPAQALDALSRYLELGAGKIDAKRRAEVETTISQNRARVGALRVNVEPSVSSIEIDGIAISGDLRQRPVTLEVGRHAVVLKAEGHEPSAQAIVVKPQETTALDVRLRMIPERTVAAPTLPVSVRCELEDVDILVDGVAQGKTPVGVVLVTPGKHRFQFARAGYQRQEFERTFDTKTSVACSLKPLSNLPSEVAGALFVTTNVSDARVYVDDVPFRNGSLAIGTHDVEVRRAGFQPWRRRISIARGMTSRLNANIQAEPEYATELRRGSERRKTWAYVLGTTGLVFSGAAVTFAIMSASEHEDYEQAQKQAQSSVSPVDQTVPLAQARAMHNHGVRVQRLDDLTIGSAVLGAALLGSGIGLFLSSNAGEGEGARAKVSSHGIEFAWGRAW